MNKPVSRTERRKQKTRELIVSTAIELFRQKSSVEVPFESIAAKADISRKTLYNHFGCKDQLIYEIVCPILSDGSDYLDVIEKKETVRMTDVLDFCLFLWNKYGSMLELLYNIDFSEHEALMRIHNTFLDKFVRLNGRATDRPSQPKLSVHKHSLVVYKCFVPLLSAIHDLPEVEILFRRAMIGLLDGLETNTTE